MTHIIITTFDDCMTSWNFVTKEEACEFSEKVNKICEKKEIYIQIAYEYLPESYKVDDAINELANIYGLDEEEEEEKLWEICCERASGIIDAERITFDSESEARVEYNAMVEDEDKEPRWEVIYLNYDVDCVECWTCPEDREPFKRPKIKKKKLIIKDELDV